MKVESIYIGYDEFEKILEEKMPNLKGLKVRNVIFAPSRNQSVLSVMIEHDKFQDIESIFVIPCSCMEHMNNKYND